MKVEQGVLIELIHAGNNLQIAGLLDLGGKTLANILKAKTPDKIREEFNIVNDYTAAEEEQIRKENTWCKEKWRTAQMRDFSSEDNVFDIIRQLPITFFFLDYYFCTFSALWWTCWSSESFNFKF